MSLTMLDPTIHEVEYSGSAAERMRDHLHQHLVDMKELCSQVRSAYDGEDNGLQDLFAELIDALEQHHGMISEQLSDLSQLGEMADHVSELEVASYLR